MPPSCRYSILNQRLLATDCRSCEAVMLAPKMEEEASVRFPSFFFDSSKASRETAVDCSNSSDACSCSSTVCRAASPK